MIFTELVLQNFGPYYGKHTINLRPKSEEDACPIILFGGMNGGGKTTLMDAMRLALYGQRAQCSNRGNLSYSDFLHQCVNSQAIPPEDQTRIELTFEHIVNDQWKELKVVRTWTKNGKDTRDNLGILEEDWPDTALANTWDEYIENLLPLGISNLFLFDGEQVKELAEQDIPPQSVMEAIKSLLGLELAEKLAIDLDILVSRKRKALANSSQLAGLEEIEAKIKHLNAEKSTISQELKSIEKNYQQAKRSYKEAASKFRLEGGKIAAEKSKLEATIQQLEVGRENQRQAMRSLAAGILPLQLILPLLRQAQVQGEKELKSQQAQIALEVLQERDRRLLDYVTNLAVETEQVEKIQAFLVQENQTLQQDIDGDDTGWLGIEAAGLKKLDNLLTHLLPMQLQIAREEREKLKQIETEINTTERQLAVAASPEAYEKLDRDLKEAQENLVECQTAYETEKRKLEAIEKSIDRAKKDLEKYSEKVLEYQNNEHIIKSTAKVQQTLKLFREKLTLKKFNKLELEVTECFRYLLHKSNLVQRVVIDTKTFALSLYDPHGQPLPKYRLSAGEKQLLAISFLWGLARVSGRNLPIAIDTPLGRLDSSHRHNLVERYFPTASHQVILLSTDTEIGKKEVEILRKQQAIAKEYLLKYDNRQGQTNIESGYFWQ